MVRCGEAVAVTEGRMSNLGKHIAGVRALREARKLRLIINLSLPGMEPRALALWCIDYDYD